MLDDIDIVSGPDTDSSRNGGDGMDSTKQNSLLYVNDRLNQPTETFENPMGELKAMFGRFDVMTIRGHGAATFGSSVSVASSPCNPQPPIIGGNMLGATGRIAREHTPCSRSHEHDKKGVNGKNANKR